VELHPNGVDYGVELFSKTDQYTAFVREDLCTPTHKPAPPEPSDGSVALIAGIAYQRKGLHWIRAGFPGGYTWKAVNQFGEVRMIHHA
jgi:hypothetical protein